ncbi:hypothetical protein TIFTF001_034368 [Ficus carica]|uniref:Uncharacterized protein n=1 Tax=Ficus carica TaxID=3494 RepID=A0AA88E3K1_FICCA|nr:hypothetical protein TIFTF001_034368 [Ficus carica]
MLAMAYLMWSPMLDISSLHGATWRRRSTLPIPDLVRWSPPGGSLRCYPALGSQAVVVWEDIKNLGLRGIVEQKSEHLST